MAGCCVAPAASVGGDGVECFVQFQPAHFGGVDFLGEFGLALEEFGHVGGLGAGVEIGVGEAFVELVFFGVPGDELFVELVEFLQQRAAGGEAGLTVGGGGFPVGLAAGLVGGFVRALGGRGVGGAALGEPVLVVVEVAVEGREAAVVDEQEAVAGGAQERAVVGDDDHAAFVVLQRQGEGVAHFEVEVVGRFVEQQQVGFAPDQQGQREAGFLAAGEGRAGGGGHVAVEVEAAEIVAQILFAGLRVEPQHVLQRGFFGAQALEGMLGEVAQLQALAFATYAGGGLEPAREQLDERGFAGAVAAEQADAAARAQGHRDVVENVAVNVAS